MLAKPGLKWRLLGRLASIFRDQNCFGKVGSRRCFFDGFDSIFRAASGLKFNKGRSSSVPWKWNLRDMLTGRHVMSGN
jgi:hypothetical protein